MARRKYRRRKYLKLKTESVRSILSVVLFLSAAITFLSFFGQAAGVGFFAQDLLNKLFGWGSFFVPFLLADLGLVLSQYGRLRVSTWPFFLGLCLLTISFISLLHLFISPEVAYLEAALGEGGGMIGYNVQLILRESISGVLAFLTLISLAIVSILMLFNTSLDTFLFYLGSGMTHSIEFIKTYVLRNISDKWGVFREERKKSRESKKEEPTKIEDEEESIEEMETEEEDIAQKVPPSFEVIYPKFEPKAEGEEQESAGGDVDAAVVSNLPLSDQVWEYPSLSLLSDVSDDTADRGDIKDNAHIIEKTLESFGVRARVAEVNLGPAITQYALELTHGTKISKITNLQNDIALALAAPTGQVRIVAPIPGRSLVGIEVPNYISQLVTLKKMLASDILQNSKSLLAVGLGLDVAGQVVIADITRMPHVLIAGSTGSGKSVLLTAMIATILYRATPNEVKLILVDPKRVELSKFRGIPHLLTDVIVDVEKVISSLKWAISEMERRYKLFESVGARNIDIYNEMSGFQALPFIIVLIDELADLMAAAPVEVEKVICRLAQMARATGIHLILATQRPSVDVLTGLIKANIPCRIAFNVSSMVDSRVIIDMPGAEKLLGKGDMLYVPPDVSKPVRIQGVFVSDKEQNNLISYLRGTGLKPEYKEEITEFALSNVAQGLEEVDELFAEAVKLICFEGKASSSLLQRKLRIGYARAARLIDELEQRGVVSQADGSKPRDVLIGDPKQVIGTKGEDNDESWRHFKESAPGEMPGV